MAKPNYHQVRRQKELARKSRQQEKQQKRQAAKDGAPDGDGSTDPESVSAAEAVSAPPSETSAS